MVILNKKYYAYICNSYLNYISFTAVLSHEALGMSNREKRQNQEEGDLEDRYGWNWPKPGRFPPWRPGPQNPNTGSRPVPVPRPLPVPRPVPVQRPEPDQSTTSTTSTANPNVDGLVIKTYYEYFFNVVSG